MTDADALREGAAQERPPQPGSPPPAAAPVEDGKVMSLVDHLSELRNRLFKCLIAVGIGSVIGLWRSNYIIEVLAAPAGGKLLNLGPGDAFAITLRVSLVTGIVLGMPVLLYQLWAFIAPGLTTTERRTIRPWIPLALVFFAVGVGIAYFILPYAMGFLYSFATGTFENLPAAGPYFDFVTTLFLAFGLIMEFPIVLIALSRVNIVTSKALVTSRRYVFLGIVIFATIATPGGDLVSPTVLATVMYVLFELTVLFIRRSGH